MSLFASVFHCSFISRWANANKWAYDDAAWEKNMAAAVADYTQALDPQYVKAYLNRGVAYSDLGEHDAAIADPNQSWSFESRAAAYLAQKAYDKAIVDLNQSIRLEPDEDYFKTELQEAKDAKAGKK
jgi:tetratricopeptide (TPR) repeat protein